MGKPSIDYDKDVSSYKKVQELSGLSGDTWKHLLKITRDFVEENESACSKRIRLWKQQHWQDLAGELLKSQNVGKKFFSADRKNFDPDKNLAWPEDEEPLKFISFSLLKIECTKYFSNKRKNESNSGTPNKRQAMGDQSSLSKKDKQPEADDESEEGDGSDENGDASGETSEDEENEEGNEGDNGDDEGGSADGEKLDEEEIQSKDIHQKDPFIPARHSFKNPSPSDDAQKEDKPKGPDADVFTMGTDYKPSAPKPELPRMSPHQGLSQTGGTNAFEASKIQEAKEQQEIKKDMKKSVDPVDGKEVSLLGETNVNGDAQSKDKTQIVDPNGRARRSEELTTGQSNADIRYGPHNQPSDQSETYSRRKASESSNHPDLEGVSCFRGAQNPTLPKMAAHGKAFDEAVMQSCRMTPASSPMSHVSTQPREKPKANPFPASIMYNVSIGALNTMVSRPVDTDFRGFYGSVMMSISPQMKRELCSCQYCNVSAEGGASTFQLCIYDSRIDATWKHLMAKMVSAAAMPSVPSLDLEVEVGFTAFP